MKKVDKLGRIVIPVRLRRKYGLDKGAAIEVSDIGDGVAVRASEPFCRICGERIPEGTTLPLCEKCLLEAAKSYNEKN